MVQINPYLSFNGQCREAMNHYKACLDAELSLMTVAESPAAERCPGGIQDHIMHSCLMKEGQVLLMATDMTNGEVLQTGGNIALSLSCGNEAEINRFFKKLGEEGRVIEPLNPQFWGDIFGVVQDKYGIVWMLTCPQGKGSD